MEPIIILLLVGAFGGLVRAVLGYETQSDDGESFDKIKALKSIVRAALGGTIAVMGIISVTNTEITLATYFSVFLLAIGTDVLTKEGYTVLKIHTDTNV